MTIVPFKNKQEHPGVALKIVPFFTLVNRLAKFKILDYILKGRKDRL